ncbi:MAG TPA: SIMPL domain-containing protein, partial [Saprospiraceae bacterium]|nr:SIMPL domain-containing protein [Saprospiraceae bacterium]
MKPTSLLFFCCLWAASVCAQVQGNFQQQVYSNANFGAQIQGLPHAATIVEGNQVEVSVKALLNQKADSYTAIFNVVQVGKTADETNSLLNARLEALLASLKALGIPEEDIYVDMVNFLPKYEYDMSKKLFSRKTYTEIPKGFELQKNIHVRYTVPALLDRIVTAAARQEIYDIVKVDYNVKDPQKHYTQLRTATTQYFEQIRKNYLSIGIRLDSAYTIASENTWVAYPVDRYQSYQAYASQRLDENDNSKVNYADKTISRFYNAVPSNDYDLVINPEILEPAVQYSYNLVVRFVLPERKPAEKTTVKKEFVLVTATGEVKSLK